MSVYIALLSCKYLYVRRYTFEKMDGRKCISRHGFPTCTLESAPRWPAAKCGFAAIWGPWGEAEPPQENPVLNREGYTDPETQAFAYLDSAQYKHVCKVAGAVCKSISFFSFIEFIQQEKNAR